MIVVYPDSNALNGNPYLQGQAEQLLDEIAAASEAELRFSPVVLDELRRQETDDVDAVEQSVAAVVRKRTRGHRAKMRTIATDVAASLDSVRAEIEDQLTTMLARDNIVTDSYPSVSAEALVAREVQRRRPFLEAEVGGKTQSFGMRDTVIWEGVRECARAGGPHQTLIFVTNDHGFLNDNKTGLHDDLLADLDADRTDGRRVVHAQSVEQAKIRVKELSEKITKEQATVANEIISLALSLDEAAVGWHYDAREGDLTESAIGAMDLPKELEDARVVAVDLVGEPVVRGTNPYVASQTVELAITGGMYISDWYAIEDSSDLEFWGNVNERYVDVGVVKQVLVEASIELDEQGSATTTSEILLRDRQPESPTAG